MAYGGTKTCQPGRECVCKPPLPLGCAPRQRERHLPAAGWRAWVSEGHAWGGMEGGTPWTDTRGGPTTCWPGPMLYCVWGKDAWRAGGRVSGGQNRQLLLGCRDKGALADGPGCLQYSPPFAAGEGRSPRRHSRRGSHPGGRTGGPWLVVEGLRRPGALVEKCAAAANPTRRSAVWGKRVWGTMGAVKGKCGSILACYGVSKS